MTKTFCDICGKEVKTWHGIHVDIDKWGNVIKYALRLGHKDDAKSDAGKLAQYSKWLMQVENGEEVKP